MHFSSFTLLEVYSLITKSSLSSRTKWFLWRNACFVDNKYILCTTKVCVCTELHWTCPCSPPDKKCPFSVCSMCTTKNVKCIRNGYPHRENVENIFAVSLPIVTIQHIREFPSANHVMRKSAWNVGSCRVG